MLPKGKELISMKHPRFSPLMTTFTVAGLVLALAVLMHYWKSDTRVSVEIAPNSYTQSKPGLVREVPQSYEESIRQTPAIVTHVHTQEIQSICLGLFLTGLIDQIEGRPARNFHELCLSAQNRALLPPGVRLGSNDDLQSNLATYQARYRAEPLAVEVFFFARRPTDGPSLAVRIPDVVAKGTPLTELRVAAKDGPIQIAEYVYSFRQPAKLPPFLVTPAEMQSFGWVPIATAAPKNGETYDKAVAEILENSNKNGR
jgi:hypothetical protein